MCTIKQASYNVLIPYESHSNIEKIEKRPSRKIFTFLFPGHFGYSLQSNAQS